MNGQYYLNSVFGESVKMPYLDKRECLKENFSPMLTESKLWKMFAEEHCQILINTIGGPAWINIPKIDIVE